MTLTRTILLTTAVLIAVPTVHAQYRSQSRFEFGDRYGDERIRPVSDGERSDLRLRFEHERRRLTDGYDYRAPLSTAVEDTFRTPHSGSSSNRGSYDYGRFDHGYGRGDLGSSRRDYGSVRQDNWGVGTGGRTDRWGRLENPFRYPTAGRAQPVIPGSYRSDRDRCGTQSGDGYQSMSERFRPVDYTSGYRGVPTRDRSYDTYRPSLSSRDSFDLGSPRSDRDYGRSPGYDVSDYRPTDYGTRDFDGGDFAPTVPSGRDNFNPSPSGADPFTPALPRRDGGMDVEAIRKAITARYSNPVNVRAVQSMTPNQGLALFREVSQQTDSRHLEPSPYDLRVRRGLRNIGVALQEPSFLKAMGASAESFRLDAFRSGLARLESSMQVSSQSDAERVLQTVMAEASKVPGLSPAVVAFEFSTGTVETLDRFSALEPKAPGRGASLPQNEITNRKSAALESEIVGIGVEVKLHDDGLIILRTLRGGPARDAGLKTGDVITAINNRSIQGMPMANSVDMMTGTSGSRLQLQVVRNGSSRHNVTLTRRRVRIYTVNDARLISGTDKVAYINLTQFGQKSTEELDQALQTLHDGGMKSLIFDLRGNPGGLLNVCVDITNRFLPCGTIVSTKGRLSSDNMLETATFSRTWSVPLVVLVDGDSASASEIFAAAVQENKRGIVVGQKSYGKGTVQTHFPLNSISGNLRLTTARFYSPDGRAMSGSGVTPDVPVVDNDGAANGDQVLREAVVIAQSQRLKDIAQAAKQCRPSRNTLIRNSFKKDLYDAVDSKQVL